MSLNIIAVVLIVIQIVLMTYFTKKGKILHTMIAFVVCFVALAVITIMFLIEVEEERIVAIEQSIEIPRDQFILEKDSGNSKIYHVSTNKSDYKVEYIGSEIKTIIKLNGR